MDVFRFRDHIIADYHRYVSSFISVAQPELRQFVDDSFASGKLWPDPLIQLNPTFKRGKSIDDLVHEGVLHEECSNVFRRNKTQTATTGEPLLLHQHQEDAIRKAKAGRNYVLTTGTGSGKSLAYIVPIVDKVLRGGAGHGIQAVIVYPMNALANSQAGELEKFLKFGFADRKGPVSFDRYTGQEDDEMRNRIIAQPPDILLTNYVMLELILSRPREKNLTASANDLQFLVLDELHTYRGRQGADVAYLLRRVRELFGEEKLQCVGTSATLSRRGTWQEQQTEVARLATRLFGKDVEADDIIGETLERFTTPLNEAEDKDVAALTKAVASEAERPLNSFEQLVNDPIARWVEGTFGVMPEPSSDRLVRSRPIPLTGSSGAAEKLARLTNTSAEKCTAMIAQTLLAGATRVRHPETNFPVFPFRLHQFVSRGDTVYATVEAPAERYLTIHGQLFSPNDRSKVLLPLCFCRECGQEYYSVYLLQDSGGQKLEPRELHERVRKVLPRDAHDRTEVPSQKQGFIYLSTDKPWPFKSTEEQYARLPPDWIEERNGQKRIIASRREKLPPAAEC